jgi:hypothetical protein
MKPREYLLMLDCVERGVSLGLQRSRKHTDTPSDDHIKATIQEAVMNEICEYWTFEDDDPDR